MSTIQSIHEGKATSVEMKEYHEHEHIDEPVHPLEPVTTIAYLDAEHEPMLHWRTYIALASMCVLQFVQLSAILAPATALESIGLDLNGVRRQNWAVNVITLCQAALGPLVASVSDMFQSRKIILIASTLLGLVGSAIAPGSQGIYRLIGAQIIIALAISAAPLSYAVPSEIMPRKWRPAAQGAINACGTIGAIVGPLMIGALLRENVQGWRTFYWIQTGLWGAAGVGLFFGYRPMERHHTNHDHLSVWQKVATLDVIGAFLLASGVALFITGLNLGGGLYAWSDAHVLGTLISGGVVLVAFGVYETYCTKTGILHHDLFVGNTLKEKSNFALLCLLFFCEGSIFFATAVWFPTTIAILFESDPLLGAVDLLSVFVPTMFLTAVFGLISTKTKSVRWPMCAAFIIWTIGLIGQATVEPNQRSKFLGFGVLVGIGLAGPLSLILAAVHLSVPKQILATASAAVVSSRSLGATIFVAAYAAAVGNRLASYIPRYVADAVLVLGLPPTSLGPLLADLAAQNVEGLSSIPGVTPQIIEAAVRALDQAYADGIRIVWIIAAVIGALAAVLVPLLKDLKDKMDYIVDAPVEELHEKHHDAE